MKRQQKHIQPPEVRTRFTKFRCSHASNNKFVGEDGETLQWKITMSHCLSLPYKSQQSLKEEQEKFKSSQRQMIQFLCALVNSQRMGHCWFDLVRRQ
jgi:hypothetical protein